MFVRIGIGIEVAKLASRSLPYNLYDAGWSSPVARRAHNPKVAGSNPAPATKKALVNRKTCQGLYRFSLNAKNASAKLD